MYATCPHERRARRERAPVETYCLATDGVSAARIEEEVIVTPARARVITLFPADQLPIANRY